jgi:4-amino-4-deoxy-L-arabinose transferase-like glycosyltransferase
VGVTLTRILSSLDFGVIRFRYLILFTFLLTLGYVVFSPFTISVDGFSYLKSSEVLFSEDFATYYTWIREPGYPLFVRFFEDIGGLLLVFLVQGLFVCFGILASAWATYKLLNITTVSWRLFVSSGLAVVLVAGYASTILQQATLIALFGLLMVVIARVVTKQEIDWLSALLVFSLLLLSTLTAVFLGLAFGLALFATLVFSGVLKPKLLLTYSVLASLGLILVMIPWLQIKGANAPEGAPDSLAIGAGTATQIAANLDPEKEVYEFIQTQAALLNLGGEFPPSSGLGIANENRIFGSPAYSPDHSCGRFLTGVEPDSLWGPIETSYRDRCVPLQTLSVISTVNRLSHAFYPITGLALLLSFLISLRFVPNLRPVVFPAFLVLSPYLFLDASISRYGALIIPLGCILALELIQPRRFFADHEPKSKP